MKPLLRDVILGGSLIAALFVWEFLKACVCTFILGMSAEEQMQVNDEDL